MDFASIFEMLIGMLGSLDVIELLNSLLGMIGPMIGGGLLQ